MTTAREMTLKVRAVYEVKPGETTLKWLDFKKPCKSLYQIGMKFITQKKINLIFVEVLGSMNSFQTIP